MSRQQQGQKIHYLLRPTTLHEKLEFFFRVGWLLGQILTRSNIGYVMKGALLSRGLKFYWTVKMGMGYIRDIT